MSGTGNYKRKENVKILQFQALRNTAGKGRIEFHKI
jgi:hypothetical protein